jgi:phosphoribosyl-AMP cyclohydrolase
MMKSIYFRSIEQLESGQALALKDILDELSFNDNGLIPVVTQDAVSQEVLMLAWMNKKSIRDTLLTGRMTYWSRSRKKKWVKGETSGHFQKLQSMRLDCDGDAILCLVKQTGAACHTGRHNCFYFEVDQSNSAVSVLSSTP